MDVFRTSLLLILLVLEGWAQIRTGYHQEDLGKFLQSDDVGEYPAATVHDSPYLCDRECIRGDRPRLCYYKFTLEDYHSLGAACGLCPLVPRDCNLPQCVTADGNERGLLTANRRLPGPSIQVCRGDRVVIDVLNVMPGRTTAIHFHGVLQQGSNTMDGVPMITQCPITEGATFRYDFVAKNDGTHFWHSHDGFQKMDGLQGSLIVRKPRSKEPNSYHYDDDLTAHVMMITDWFETGSDQKFPGLRLGPGKGQEPVSFLVNGKGRVSPPVPARSKTKIVYGKKSDYRKILLGVVQDHIRAQSKRQPLPTPPETQTPKVPLTTYTVRHGRRYRFRIIGGTCSHCPVELSISQHRMLLIATDGNAVKPVYVDRIVVMPGERYDVIIEAYQPRSAYWIQLRGLGSCEERNISGVAILRYKGGPHRPHWRDPEYAPVNPMGTVILNPVDNVCGPTEHNVCIHHLESLEKLDERLLKRKPDVKLNFDFDFKIHTVEETFHSGVFQRFLQPVEPFLATAFMNNISNVLAGSPLLTQYNDIPPEQFCPAGGCPSGVCECLHIVKIPLNSLVEIVFADGTAPVGSSNHPFHIHGHRFRVLQLGQFTESQRRHSRSREWAVDNATEHVLSDERHHYGHGHDYGHDHGHGHGDHHNHGGGWFAAKDTIAVPEEGYAVIRFMADNPGFWMVHCHFIYHQAVGMHLVLQVGELDEMPRAPPGFPTCGNFVGEVDTSSYEW